MLLFSAVPMTVPFFVTYLTVATGNYPSVLSVLALVTVALLFNAPGRPSLGQSTIWVLILSSCAVVPLFLVKPLVLPIKSSYLPTSTLNIPLRSTGLCYAAALTSLTAGLGRGVIGNLALIAARMDGVFRPIMMRVLPTQLMIVIYSATRNSYMRALGGGRYGPYSGDFHKVECMGLTFRNDLGNAAGMDKDGSLLEWMYRIGAGFAVVGTVLAEPHTGNKFVMGRWNPWVPLASSHSGLNSLGLPSKGIDAAVENIRVFLTKFHPSEFPIGISIMGHPLQTGAAKQAGILECVRKSVPVADFIEINESCPNVQHGHSDDAELSARLAAIIAARDAVLEGLPGKNACPVLVKLGKLGDIRATCRLLAAAGVDGLVGLNTQTDYDSFDLPPADVAVLKAYTEKYNGGLSGAAIADRAADQMAEAARVVAEEELPLTLVHVGGIRTAADVTASRASGVPLREWYTGLMEAVSNRNVCSIYKDMTM